MVGRRAPVTLIAAGFAAGAVVALAAVALLATSPQEAADARLPPVLPSPVVDVELTELKAVTEAPCEPVSKAQPVAAPARTDVETLVVEGLPLKVGDRIATGTVLYTISGRPRIAVETALPFYRDLAPGDVGADVERLERSLVEAGLLAASDATFDESTGDAVENLYRKGGLGEPVLSGLPRGRLDLDVVASVPIGATVASIDHRVADLVQPGDQMLSVSGRSRTLRCSIPGSIGPAPGSQVDVVSGSERHRATVLGSGDASADSSAAPSTLVELDAGAGAAGAGPMSVEVITAQTKGEVLAVPIGALFARPDGRTELRRLPAAGSEGSVPDHASGLDRFEPVAVEIGVTANGYAEVISDELREGDQVAVRGQADS